MASFHACGNWSSSYIWVIHLFNLLDKLALQDSIDTALLYVFQCLRIYVPRNIE